MCGIRSNNNNCYLVQMSITTSHSRIGLESYRLSKHHDSKGYEIHIASSLECVNSKLLLEKAQFRSEVIPTNTEQSLHAFSHSVSLDSNNKKQNTLKKDARSNSSITF